MDSSSSTAGRGDRPSIIRRFNLPHGSRDRRPWPWLREELDRRFGKSPSPAPDTDPAGCADEARAKAAGPPTAKRVLGWGTERFVRHVSTRDGRTINARVFAASPWADSEGVRDELIRVGERSLSVLAGRRPLDKVRNVHCVEGTAEDVSKLRRRADVKAVVAFADCRAPGRYRIFVRGGGRGLMPETLLERLLAALLHLPAKWPWVPDPDPDFKPGEDRVSIQVDPQRVAAAKAYMVRRRHRIEAKSRMRFTVTARPAATDSEWVSDWEAYKRILLSPGEPARIDRAPPLIAAA